MNAMLSRAREHAGPLAVRLTQGRAADLSDAEMARCFADCAAPSACLTMARVLRDIGEFIRVGDEWRVLHGVYDDAPADDPPSPRTAEG